MVVESLLSRPSHVYVPPKIKEIDSIQTAFDTFKAQHEADVAGLERNVSSLQSALEARKWEVVAANQRLSILQTDLEVARKGTKALGAQYDTQVARLQHEGSNLQSSLDALQVAVAEANQRWTPGIGDFKQWMCEDSNDHGGPLNSLSENHYVLVQNALLSIRSQNWSSAYLDAKKVSLDPLLHMLTFTYPPVSQSISAHRLWAILPVLSHKSECVNWRKRFKCSTSRSGTVIRTRVISCCLSRSVIHLHSALPHKQASPSTRRSSFSWPGDMMKRSRVRTI